VSDQALTPGPAPGDGIDFVRFGGDPFGSANAVPTQGVLTIPDGVRSFSFAIGGGTDGLGNDNGVGRGVFVNVPCEPGDVWALGGGDPPSGSNDMLTQARSPWPSTSGGGPFFYPGFGPDDTGRAGGDGAFLVQRVVPASSGTWRTWAIGGGQGGYYSPGSDPGGSPVPATGPVPTTVGDPIAYAGAAPTVLPVLRGGGAGGGLPPGSGGGAAGTPGSSGGSYFPPSYNLGGPPSPPPAEAFPGTDFDAWSGGVAVWWYQVPPPMGWRVGHIGLGDAAW